MILRVFSWVLVIVGGVIVCYGLFKSMAATTAIGVADNFLNACLGGIAVATGLTGTHR